MGIIFSCTEKIQSALRQKRKSIALSYLRSKKQLEDLLTKRLGSLETLQSTLMRVEGAAGDVEVCALLLLCIFSC
jgi:charged multivesicular body protein 7